MSLPDYDEPITTSNGPEIIEYTENLMREAGLSPSKWRAELFQGKRALGRCSFKRGKFDPDRVIEGIIKISSPWYVTLGIDGMAELAPGEFERHALEDTIRHEIAHALCVEHDGRKHGKSHGHRWKHWARKVHAIPERCGKNLPSRLMASYKRICPSCDTVYKWLHQYSETKHNYFCTKCNAPRQDSFLTVVDNPEQIV